MREIIALEARNLTSEDWIKALRYIPTSNRVILEEFNELSTEEQFKLIKIIFESDSVIGRNLAQTLNNNSGRIEDTNVRRFLTHHAARFHRECADELMKIRCQLLQEENSFITQENVDYEIEYHKLRAQKEQYEALNDNLNIGELLNLKNEINTLIQENEYLKIYTVEDREKDLEYREKLILENERLAQDRDEINYELCELEEDLGIKKKLIESIKRRKEVIQKQLEAAEANIQNLHDKYADIEDKLEHKNEKLNYHRETLKEFQKYDDRKIQEKIGEIYRLMPKDDLDELINFNFEKGGKR